ncbi:hypothetical protein DFS34DRAFT_576478 [Phlyctochytrium arcticum]|nr:hypothetical protein DFS34DRAFT_576478 [Phlyctochytrium arcticum]
MASLAASSSTSSTSSTASPSSLATSTTTATSSSTTTLVNPDDHHSSLSPSANNGSLSVTPPSTPRSYKCEFDGCGKVFTRMYNLKSHAKAHTGARPYACPACPITFLRKHDMKRHFASLHDAEKQYKCPNCGAGFARTDALRRHMDVEARMSRGELTEMDLTAMGEGTAAVAAEPLVTTALETSAVPA